MIKYNDPESSHERGEQQELTLQQEKKVIAILNARLFESDGVKLSQEEATLIQSFVNHYQNMCHYVAYTGGLWATDQPDKISDPEKLLFQVWFKGSKSED